MEIIQGNHVRDAFDGGSVHGTNGRRVGSIPRLHDDAIGREEETEMNEESSCGGRWMHGWMDDGE